MARPAACHSPPAWLLLGAAALLLFASAPTAQDCLSATFSDGRTFARCNTLPVLGASLHWTYHPENGTADVAFRAASGSDGWVAWGINTERPGAMPGSSVLVASQGGSGAVSVLMTYLESTAPTLTNGTLKFAVPVGPAAEYSGGAYTILQSTKRLDFFRLRLGKEGSAWNGAETLRHGEPSPRGGELPILAQKYIWVYRVWIRPNPIPAKPREFLAYSLYAGIDSPSSDAVVYLSSAPAKTMPPATSILRCQRVHQVATAAVTAAAALVQASIQTDDRGRTSSPSLSSSAPNGPCMI